MTGRVIDGTEAERIGLFNRVWPAANFEAELGAFVSELASGPTRTYAAWKLGVNRSVLQELDAFTDYEQHLTAQVRQTADYAEGRAPFVEKRSPPTTVGNRYTPGGAAPRDVSGREL